ncbi:hypothetical protein, partial [Paenibacillus lutrae]|uniref:hypothetical protein n=1 Tax=Paenibacillus lutrae TaxID=2078573 RepID=UPI001F1EE1E4
ATWLWRTGGSKQKLTAFLSFLFLQTRQTPEFHSEQRSLSAIWLTDIISQIESGKFDTSQ